MKNDKVKFPVDYKVQYTYRNIKRKRYITSFSPSEALQQFDELADHDHKAIFDIALFEWNKYKTPPMWVKVTELS